MIKLVWTKNNIIKEVFHINSITQELKYKQSIVYKKHKKTIYRWIDKYDGTIASLTNKSRRPHTSPNDHTKSEIKLIRNYKRKNKDTGLVVLWVKLMQAGYKRSIASLYRMLVKLEIYNKVPSKKKKYEPKLYQPMKYPGERVQVDVKYVPKACMTKELIERKERYYQYTAIDEFSRQRVVMATKEHSTYESAKFVRLIIKKFKFNIEIIQTDNGFEFTNRLSYTADRSTKTFFEKELEINGIKHKLIKPRTPKQNGKVERSHRKDQENLYYDQKFLNFEDFKRKLNRWIKEYNNTGMKPLNWKSPNQILEEYRKLTAEK